MTIPPSTARLPLIAHVIYRLDTGGLENGLVNLINHMPENRYRHAILCLKGHTEFRRRLRRNDVMLFDLEKREGQDWGLYWRLLRIFRSIQPQIVHTRNLATLEAAVPAWLAGVKVRIHGEHGRDIGDLNGENKKNILLRRALMPFVSHTIALSRDLESYVQEKIRVKPAKITQIYNGVDADTFHPADNKRPDLPYAEKKYVVFGSVGRMQAVKDHALLVRAFIMLIRTRPEYRDTARLMIVGDGPLRQEALSQLELAGCGELAWLPGGRDDIPDIMRQMDVFVLPSLAEGISNTILEAMASGLPVIATRVGGNTELVREQVTGQLVPASDAQALTAAMLSYLAHRPLIESHGRQARLDIETRYSMQAMVNAYLQVYDTRMADK